MTNVLIVGAHPDDEVLGCGGTMARFAARGDDVHVLLLADGETSRASGGQEEIEARGAAALRAGEILGCRSVTLHTLPDNRLDTVALLDIVQLIEKRMDEVRPEVVFAHHGGDVNVDHRMVHEAVLAACRPIVGSSVRQLYFYEVASSTEWRVPHSAQPFLPNAFFDIEPYLEAKREALLAYEHEMRPFPHPRSLEAVEALARWRGATAGVAAAEAFVVGRLIERED